ncbi:MAG: hypothetical protein CMG44_03465 [Candidatus Marinimicrobia bacterium]|nr:hypothetical protein [Candidatus Neomarinimicrobiota bacterium]|tara:strand:+ start:6366 stop:6905 length:540 start_codon:yes stop_codon:yes gene_type:complete
MNRYEFEDKISDYIDNQLSVSERKDFEDYLNSDNEAKELVESVQKTIRLLSSAQSVKSSSEFLPNLTNRINSEKKNISKRSKQKTSNHFFGFTPINASLMAVLLLCFISLSLNLLSSEGPTMQSNIVSNTSSQIKDIAPQSFNSNTNLVSTISDTSDTTSIPRSNIKLDKKIKLVKNQR